MTKETTILRTSSSHDKVAYRVSSDGIRAKLYRCRSNGIWRCVKEMSLKEFFVWSDRVGLIEGEERVHKLLKELADPVSKPLYTE